MENKAKSRLVDLIQGAKAEVVQGLACPTCSGSLAKKELNKNVVVGGPASVLKKTKDKRKARPKTKPHQGLTNAELHELAKTNKPPQSWYDEDHTGLY